MRSVPYYYPSFRYRGEGKGRGRKKIPEEEKREEEKNYCRQSFPTKRKRTPVIDTLRLWKESGKRKKKGEGNIH